MLRHPLLLKIIKKRLSIWIFELFWRGETHMDESVYLCLKYKPLTIISNIEKIKLPLCLSEWLLPSFKPYCYRKNE
ncbi:hypothetical protein BpHYR1_003481 [Brachionus plicatilis]|uniref:Uncharacterized protein n=1 Tax=Brachionus plicatilis TaxID=10195 RepID=A0A3M7T0W7_BRAPC|nr:hypothetical protein BpHYR1_003481 [Brachionus plicatilis]